MKEMTAFQISLIATTIRWEKKGNSTTLTCSGKKSYVRHN